jgi:hypothetical protein
LPHYDESVLRRGTRRNVGLVAVLAALSVTAVFVAAGSSAAAPRAKPDRGAVIAYWTSQRIAHAVPRSVSPKGFQPQAKPPGPGGGGGGGGTTGAAWTGGGKVKVTTGKVLFTMDGVDYVCSGSVASDTGSSTSLILTAGHCVYDESGSGFATNWMFVPDYENGGAIVTNPDGSHSITCDTVPYGCWTAQALVTTTAWANGGASLAGFNDDYAFAVVGAGGKTGESKQLDTTVGSNPVAFNQAHPTQVYSFGYPQASPYNGQKLIYCSGTDIADTWGGTTDFGLNCNLTGGSSGGPWYVGFGSAGSQGSLNSVNSFKYTSGKFAKYMFGPYFDAYTQKTYNAAKAAPGSNTLVSP